MGRAELRPPSALSPPATPGAWASWRVSGNVYRGARSTASSSRKVADVQPPGHIGLRPQVPFEPLGDPVPWTRGRRGHGWLWPHSLRGRAGCEPMLLASEPHPPQLTASCPESWPLGSHRTARPCVFRYRTHSSVGVRRTLTPLGFVASTPPSSPSVPLLTPVPALQEAFRALPGQEFPSFRSRPELGHLPPWGVPCRPGRVPLWAPRPDGHRAPHTAGTQCVRLLCASTRASATVTFKQGHSDMCLCPQTGLGWAVSTTSVQAGRPGRAGLLARALLAPQDPKLSPPSASLFRSLPLPPNPGLVAVFSVCPSYTPGLSGQVPCLPQAGTSIPGLTFSSSL